MKTYEIQGVNFENKGAELMLRGTVDHLKAVAPQANVVLPFRIGSFRQRAELGLGHLTALHRERIPHINTVLTTSCDLAPRALKRKYRFASLNDISAVIDASGFRYSDQWGVRSIADQAEKAEKLRAQGRSLVFLPQAFGPFKAAETRKLVKRMVENSTLVFARDEVSLKHLQEAAGDLPQLRMAPDFTNLVTSSKDAPPLPPRTLVIVPNSRMIDKTDEQTGAAYLQFLSTAIKEAAKHGFTPVVMVHDALGDAKLAATLRQDFNGELKEISDPDPLVLKRWLAQADGVIGSRFHALVGALASGTPTIAVGWSHKYNELMSDYGMPELSLKVSDLDLLNATIQAWADVDKRQAAVDALTIKANALKERSRDMWRQVDAALGIA